MLSKIILFLSNKRITIFACILEPGNTARLLFIYISYKLMVSDKQNNKMPLIIQIPFSEKWALRFSLSRMQNILSKLVSIDFFFFNAELNFSIMEEGKNSQEGKRSHFLRSYQWEKNLLRTYWLTLFTDLKFLFKHISS